MVYEQIMCFSFDMVYVELVAATRYLYSINDFP